MAIMTMARINLAVMLFVISPNDIPLEERFLLLSVDMFLISPKLEIHPIGRIVFLPERRGRFETR
jgi:hypothetical protein